MKDNSNKLCVAVIYGGDSTERDVSVITAVQAMKNLKDVYRIYPLLLEDNGFYTVERADEIKSYIGGVRGKKQVYLDKDGVFEIGLLGRKNLFRPDCCLLCTHGGTGENGALQGYLDVAGLPYTSSGVRASAVGMDKELSKKIFSALGLNVTPYVTVTDDGDDSVEKAERTTGYPIIVKPVAQGSSIGIAVANNREELRQALATALAFDDRAICEKALTDFTELNCAVLVRDGKTVVSEIEQPLTWDKFLSFEQKYLSDGKMSGGGRIYPAKVSGKVEKEVKAAALAAYEGMGAKGVVRIDFLVDDNDGTVYVNEANTIPGSLATYLFRDNGMGYADVVAAAVNDAILRSKRSKTVKFGSNVLDVYGKSSANACKMHGKIL